MSQKTDEWITQDALEELTGNPAVTKADLNGSPDAGWVLLTGTAQTSRTTWQAQEAASRLGAVSAVENAIVVDPPALGLRPDKAIAADIRSALALDYHLPADGIAVSVVDGYVTLTGTVDWDDQKEAADNDAAMILGVKGVDNEILVKQPQASAADIPSEIARAFARNAELFDDNIEVATNGGHVTLSGTVATWKEYDLAEETAWMAPGVTSLTNHITVLFPYSSLKWR